MEGRICAIESCLRVPPNPSRFELHPGHDESRTHPQCHTDDESEMAQFRRFDGKTLEQSYDNVAFDKLELNELKMFMDKHYDHGAAKKRATDPDHVFTEENHKILGDLQKEVGKHIKEDIKNGVKRVLKKIF